MLCACSLSVGGRPCASPCTERAQVGIFLRADASITLPSLKRSLPMLLVALDIMQGVVSIHIDDDVLSRCPCDYSLNSLVAAYIEVSTESASLKKAYICLLPIR